MIFKLGELFSGPGGLAYGAKTAKLKGNRTTYGIDHVWAYDNDSDSCETYRKNICPKEPNIVEVRDVKELKIEKLSPIDAFAYGFPCNDFSVVGEHNGIHGDYGPLCSYGVKVLDCHHPMWFFAENVGGLQSANDGLAFKMILGELANAGPGYKLTPHLYKFEEYGVPQTRHRIIIIGIRNDLNVDYKVPAPTTLNPKEQITAKNAIEDPPIHSNASNHEYTNQSKTVVERLNHIPAGKNAWYDGIPEHLKLNVKGAKLSQIYRRLHPDRPAYTITGSGGGGTHGYHWEEPRALTNRERARLQTFPDTFIFEGKKESVRKQIGMAVPPKGVKIIIEAVFKSFAGIEYETFPAKWGFDNATASQIKMDL